MDLQKLAAMPTVGSVMTPSPHSVRPSDAIREVERLMKEHQIRHIPVQEDGRVVGIISERDLHRLTNPSLPKIDKRRIRASAISTRDPYAVDANTPLAEVVSEMARRQIGSAIVLEDEKLAGILSVTDVCRLLAEVIETFFAGRRA